MAFLSRRLTFPVALLLLWEDKTYAFTSPAAPWSDANLRTFTSKAFHRPKLAPWSLSMAGEDSSSENISLQTKSGKELTYDEKSGRFYESELVEEEEECDPQDEYCAIDKSSGERIRLTLEEKERIFLDALQSFYASGRQLLSDADFDLLKEDLQWNGSEMVVMNRKEVRFVSAMMAYKKGEPNISDAEYDTLKSELKEEGSKFAVSREPICYIDAGVCKATFEKDFFRTNLLYLPLGATLTLIWLTFGFELFHPLVALNPLALLVLGAFPIYKATKTITEDLVFGKFTIAYGPCPACGAENRIYFGDILKVEGFKKVADLKCTTCKADFRIQRETLRASTLPKQA